MPTDRIRRVFVRAPNWVGDVVMATPSFARIRSFFLDAEIVCGVKAGHGRILAGSKSFDRILSLGAVRGPAGLLRQARALRREKFDAAILFPNSLSSALVCAVAGIRYRVGYVQGRRLLITHGIRFRGHRKPFWVRRGPRRDPVPMADYYAALCDAFGMPRVGPHPILRITPGEAQRAGEVFARYGVGAADRLVLFSPTASFGPSKLWYEERWAALAQGLLAARPELRILVLCGPGEEDVARGIERRAGLATLRATLPPVPLDVLKPVVRRASLMVTTDSGPRHVAVAFDVPHVVLMGPTHPGYTDAAADLATVLRHEVECGPCHLPVCPIDHRCMKLIETEEVVRAALARLEPGGLAAAQNLPRAADS